MKEIDYDEFLDNYEENMKILEETGEVWILTHKGRKELVVMHKNTHDRMHCLNS